MWIAQDTRESGVPWLNVHTNQILAHTFSHGTLDFLVSLAINTVVCVLLLILLAFPTNTTFWKRFCILFIYFLVVALATTMFLLMWMNRYSLTNQATAQLERAAILFVFSRWRHSSTNQEQWYPCLCTYTLYVWGVGGGGWEEGTSGYIALWWVRAMSCSKPRSSHSTPVCVRGGGRKATSGYFELWYVRAMSCSEPRSSHTTPVCLCVCGKRGGEGGYLRLLWPLMCESSEL